VRRSSSSRRIVVVVVSPVDELDLVGPLQVFNSVNRLAGKPIYSIEVATNTAGRTIEGEGGVLAFVAGSTSRKSTACPIPFSSSAASAAGPCATRPSPPG
jgi:hypothetical protein